jgi:tetratricopeptide (TPR) repeat protein
MVTLILVLVLSATAPDSKELAQKGYTTFKAVLAGDEAKLPDAIRYMEEARTLDEKYVPNLYNLARAYFFDAATFNKGESLAKSEKIFARMLELEPGRTDALAFHAAVLTFMSGGRDMAMFMRGAEEIKTAIQRTPDDLTVRIVLGFTMFNLPPQARAMISTNDSVGNLKFIGNKLDKFESDFAPHASVVMNAIIGEGLMAAGDKEKARASFEKALQVPQPYDEGQIKGRKLLDDVIKARMDGGSKPIFAEPIFSGCHSCHLAAPDKLLPR